MHTYTHTHTHTYILYGTTKHTHVHEPPHLLHAVVGLVEIQGLLANGGQAKKGDTWWAKRYKKIILTTRSNKNVNYWSKQTDRQTYRKVRVRLGWGTGVRERGTVRGNTENNNTCKPGLGRSLSEVLDHGQLRHLPYPLCLSGETIFGTTIFGTGWPQG